MQNLNMFIINEKDLQGVNRKETPTSSFQEWKSVASMKSKLYMLGLNHKKGPFSLQRRREMYRFLFRMKDQWNSNTKSRWAAEIRIEIRYRPRHGKMCCCSEILFEKGARSEVQKSYIVNQREESYSLQCESVTEELDGWLKTRMDESSIIFSS